MLAENGFQLSRPPFAVLTCISRFSSHAYSGNNMRISYFLLSLNVGRWFVGTLAVPTSSKETYADDMFKTAIEWNDKYWDDDAGYLIAAASNPGRYDSRHTAWYATQLLSRNAPGDVARAVRIFDNVISGQYLDPSKQWYGDYQQSPSEPEPGTAVYPNKGPYTSVSLGWIGMGLRLLYLHI